MSSKLLYIEVYNPDHKQPAFGFMPDFRWMIPEKFWHTATCDTRDLGRGYKEAIFYYDDGEEGAGEVEKYLSLKKRVNDE